MQISLVHSFVKDLELKNPLITNDVLKENVTEDKEKKETFTIGFSVAYPENKDDEFEVIFTTTVNLASGWILNVEYVSIFKTSDPTDDTFKDSPFPVVNAPAIAFPFLRSFVATLLLNAGHPAVIFPAINFTTFEKEQETKIQ